jgi:pyridoxal phosphate enzyme (YggS family)
MIDRVAENLAQVRERIATAARASGRSPESVTLIAVTKYVVPEVAAALVAGGCHDLGESRPQELWKKAAALNDAQVRWHLIGHLQRNKIERTLPLLSLVHSADSLRLIESLDSAAASQERKLPILLEVNVSGDLSKHGFQPDELEPRLETLVGYRHVEIRGLMAMAGREGDLDAARREFASLRQLRDRLEQVSAGKLVLGELSMGMSGDYEVAIAEGATLVRVGSALVEGLQ